jgi:hypothetical protein
VGAVQLSPLAASTHLGIAIPSFRRTKLGGREALDETVGKTERNKSERLVPAG